MMRTRPYPLDLSDAVVAYTDGSAVGGNPGHAGIAAKVGDDLVSEYVGIATNNFAEMYAIERALLMVDSHSVLHLHTDSKLALCLITGVWTVKDETLADVLKAIRHLLVLKEVWLQLAKVKAHSSDYQNAIVDQAANTAARRGLT